MSEKEKLTFILYDSPNPPRYIKISKFLLKSFIFIIPIVIILLVTVTTISLFFTKQKIRQLRDNTPREILEYQEKTEALSSQILQLQSTNNELLEKISKGAIDQDAIFSLISQPLGFENYADRELTKIDNISIQERSDQVHLKFDLINNLENNEKLAGYIVVIKYSEAGIQIYPQSLFQEGTALVDYTSGESFTIAKFRPVIAEFGRLPNEQNLQFKIYIFSRTGNILDYKLSQKFNLEK